MPAWLAEGLPVLLYGVGIVALTLFILYLAIDLFGRAMGRAGGRAGASGPADGVAADHGHGDEVRAADTADPPARREFLRAAAVAAAIEAYVAVDDVSAGWTAAPDQGTSPAAAAPGGACSAGGWAAGSAWVSAGRVALMSRRQDITGRRGRSHR